MGRLGDHAHIVTVFDVGDEGGEPYIVSQYIAGGDLAGVPDKTAWAAVARRPGGASSHGGLQGA